MEVLTHARKTGVLDFKCSSVEGTRDPLGSIPSTTEITKELSWQSVCLAHTNQGSIPTRYKGVVLCACIPSTLEGHLSYMGSLRLA